MTEGLGDEGGGVLSQDENQRHLGGRKMRVSGFLPLPSAEAAEQYAPSGLNSNDPWDAWSGQGRESTLCARKKGEKKFFQGAANSVHGAWGSSSILPCKQSSPEILGTGPGSKEDRGQTAQTLPSALGGAWARKGARKEEATASSLRPAQLGPRRPQTGPLEGVTAA